VVANLRAKSGERSEMSGQTADRVDMNLLRSRGQSVQFHVGNHAVAQFSHGISRVARMRRASSNMKPLPTRLSDGPQRGAKSHMLRPHDQRRAIDQTGDDSWNTQRRLPQWDPTLSRSDFVQRWIVAGHRPVIRGMPPQNAFSPRIRMGL